MSLAQRSSGGVTPTSSDSDATRLEDRLLRVFRAAHTDPRADLLLRRRVALTFLFTGPDAAIRVDGGSGVAADVTAGEAARAAPSDLTFRISAAVAHALWTGELNPVSAMMAGQLSIQGPLPLALALSPSLKVMQAAYRAVIAEGG
jgi:hypothetical protein